MKKKTAPPVIDQTIVVTGTRGFKGSKLLKALEENDRYRSIVVVDQRKPNFELKKSRYYKLDLTQPTADLELAEILKKEKCDTLIHCALPITPPRNPSYAHELISIGTMYVLNACAEAKVRKFILASTTDVYGAQPTNPNFLLEDLHKPRGELQSKFLADKIDAEKQALRYAKKHPESLVTILRACTIVGPTIQSYKTRVLSRFFVTTILGFDPLLQFIHEEDLIQSFLLAIEKDVQGTFNVVGDGVLPLSRVIDLAGKPNLRLPQMGFKTLVQLLWLVDLSPAPASHVDFLRYLCVADGSKAKKILGFEPKYSSKEALMSFIEAERIRAVSQNAA